MSDNKVLDFLRLMSGMESSFGKNTDHEQVADGRKAVGQYGLMSPTAKDMAKANIKAGKATKMDKIIANADDDTINELLKDPRVEQHIASSLASHVLDKSGGKMEDAAFRWRWGQNVPEDKLQKIKMKNEDYTKRISNILGGKPQQTDLDKYKMTNDNLLNTPNLSTPIPMPYKETPSPEAQQIMDSFSAPQESSDNIQPQQTPQQEMIPQQDKMDLLKRKLQGLENA